jgi:hypothetical protein
MKAALALCTLALSAMAPTVHAQDGPTELQSA